MSYKAEIEFVLHIHNFRNVQIDRQGFAAIKVEIVDESSKNPNFALPFNIVPYHKPTLNYAEAEINDSAYQSSTMRIQYQDEKYYLNDIVQFKLLLESLPELNTKNIYIKFTLLFSTLHAYDRHFDLVANSMETITFRLENIEVGLFHYYEAEFTENYASNFNFTLFSMITDFKLYPYSMRKQVIDESEHDKKKEREREKIMELEDMLIWASKYIKKCQEPLRFFYNCYAKILRYNSYVLRGRVNEMLKKKKQVSLKLPKFYKEEQTANEKQFFDFFTKFHGENVNLKQFKQEIYELHEENFFFVQEIAQLISKGLFDTKKLTEQYQRFIYSEYFSRFVKEVRYGESLTNTSHAEETLSIANKIRKQKKQTDLYPIINAEKKKDKEYIFYEVSYAKSLIGIELEKMKMKLKYGYDERNMVVVMCHGFQGSSYDMKIIQRGIKEALPLAEFMISCANEGDTDGDIDQMGKRVSEEIKRFINRENLPKDEVILNFVGHSMGGIIARSCLKYIPEYHERLGFYCSLSSPHLGYSHGADGMIKAGLWVMRKMMKEATSLNQLSMQDSQKPMNSFLFNLSLTGSLKNFAKVILISSAEDSYVPWHSARICGYKSKKSSSKIDIEMANNIIGDQTVHRIDVNFAVEKNDIDGFIGRKAHINLIVNDSIFKLVNAVIPKLFDLQDV